MLLKEFEAALEDAVSGATNLREGVDAVNKLLNSCGMPLFHYLEESDEAQSLSPGLPPRGNISAGNLLRKKFQRPIWISWPY